MDTGYEPHEVLLLRLFGIRQCDSRFRSTRPPSLAAIGFLFDFSIGACEAVSIGSSDSSLTGCPGEELGYFSAFSVQD